MLHRSLWALIAIAAPMLAMGPACGNEEFVAASPGVEAGVGGSAGHGGKDGSAGLGGAPEGGGPDAHKDADKEAKAEAAAGSAGQPLPEAGKDAIVEAGPSCAAAGFLFVPDPPVAKNFDVEFQHADAKICVRMTVLCSNGPAMVGPTDVADCGTLPVCWKAAVSGCEVGAATVRFFYDADDPTDPQGYCHVNFPQSPGKQLSECQFKVVAP